MHQSSYERMRRFAERIQTQFAGGPVRVLDVGSMGVNGTYKELFCFPGVDYVGLDIAPGPNVDVVPADGYCWPELKDESFDVVVSGQALEHIEFPWLVVEQIARKLKVGGIACLIAPSRGPEHRYPVDCYRYYPDGMRALARWAGLTVEEVEMVRGPSGFSDGSDQWGDCHCILQKQSTAGEGVKRPAKSAPPAAPGKIFRHHKNPLALGKNEPYYQFSREEVVQSIVQWGVKADEVFELGCSSGGTGRRLKEALGVRRYIGVELSQEAAQQARAHLDEVIVADIEKTPPAELGLKEQSFDLVMALDVLEHLYDPWETLSLLVSLLRPGGSVVASIPNVQNLTILLGLSEGRWRYENAGLLDATHVRFFTLEGIRELMEGAGLELVDVRAVLNPPVEASSIKPTGNTFQQGKLTLSAMTADDVTRFFAYQYILLARRPAGGDGG